MTAIEHEEPVPMTTRGAPCRADTAGRRGGAASSGRAPQTRSGASSCSPRTRAARATARLLAALAEEGFQNPRQLGSVWVGTKRFNFTTAIVVGLRLDGYERRYCYEHAADAEAALVRWDGAGHPSGPWIKCKGSGIDLINPNLRW